MTVNASAALQAYLNAARTATGSGVGGVDSAATGEGGNNFADLVSQSLGDMLTQTRAGEQAIADTATGKGNLIDVVTAIAQAETTLETIVAIRDRVISAYQEVMKMPI